MQQYMNYKCALAHIIPRYYGDSLPFGKNSTSKDPLKVICRMHIAQCSLHNVLQIYGCHPLQVGYLSSSQALADYADLITSLKVFTATVSRHGMKLYAFEKPFLQLQMLQATIPGAETSPVIVFGGSYGGMLAAWFRCSFFICLKKNWIQFHTV